MPFPTYTRAPASTVKYVNPAFDQRVQDAIKMLLANRPKDEIKQKHGRIVFEESQRKWKEFWQGFSFNTEGHAKMKTDRLQ